LFPAESIVLAAEATPFARLQKEVMESLKDSNVMIVGVGSGGSEIALNLACSGVGRLELVDPDRLHPENYIRFPAGMQDLGRHKVDIVRSLIVERELPTIVNVHHVDVVGDADEFRGLFPPKIDLIICATYSIASRRLVNSTAVRMNIPCIVAGTLNHGKIGEVLRVEPYRSPCYECVRLELGAVLDEPLEDDIAATPYLDSDERQLVGSALRMDIIVPAALASHVALQILNPAGFPPAPASYIVWGREPGRDFSHPFQFEYPFSANFVPLKRRTDCPVCGAVPSELVGVDVAQRVNEILAEADRASA
jgi:molybdopterin/thiamine biosynthesis adenylyltransferase